MGYRNYFSRILKTDLQIFALSQDYEFRREKTQRLYELGKYIDPRILIVVKDVSDWSEEETEYKAIELDSIKNVVKVYSDLHIHFLTKVSEKGKNEEETSLEDIPTPAQFVEEQINHWCKAEKLVYNDEKDQEEIVRSWEYQYEIFEMLRIYKTFDSENHYLIWEGH